MAILLSSYFKKMAVNPIRQLGNMRGQVMRNVGKPIDGTDALTWAIPSFTTTTRDLIPTKIAGMVIFNTTLLKHQGYDGTNWNNLY